MKKNFFTNNLVLVLILLILSIISGFLGAILTRTYIIDDLYFNPFSSELNLSGYNYNPANLVIRDPKKVVVSQDVKIAETANNAKKHIIHLFYKEDAINLETEVFGTSTPVFSSADLYSLANSRSSALSLTSDGWVLAKTQGLDLSRDLVAVDLEKNIYEVDQSLTFVDEPLALLHLYQASLSPVSFSDSQDLISGQSLLLLGKDRQMLTYLLGKERDSNFVKSSDNLFSPLILSTSDLESGSDYWLFDFQGEAIAFFNQAKWLPLDKYSFFWRNALSSGEDEVSAPVLGVNYINLSKVAITDFKQSSGALIYPNQKGVAVQAESAADLAGLQAGDIIRAVGSLELNADNDLAEVLSNYLAGETLDLTILRDNALMIITVNLNK
ncbi:MAG: PDZ domain-containing protein [Candidatus Pacebacteria bacterium]|nr:PDZ domain-containing protein [Candidatus Paceibacterota bacterium]